MLFSVIQSLVIIITTTLATTVLKRDKPSLPRPDTPVGPIYTEAENVSKTGLTLTLTPTLEH
jgi:hypothetical protein